MKKFFHRYCFHLQHHLFDQAVILWFVRNLKFCFVRPKQLEQAQERISEVSRIIKRLYEDNVNGKISDERFMELSADYEQEQRELKDRAAALQAELDKSQAATVNAEKFMGIVRKHLAFEELTPTLLREMIEKIVVHECSYDENGTRRQDIEIYYSFVGKIDLPEA